MANRSGRNHVKETIEQRERMAQRPDRPKFKEATFFLKGIAMCPDCGHTMDITINLDREVYHECNEGNVRTTVPQLVLKVDFPLQEDRTPVKKEKTELKPAPQVLLPSQPKLLPASRSFPKGPKENTI